MKLATYAYIPPRGVVHSQVYWENIHRYKTTHPLVTFSEAPWPGVTVKLKAGPDCLAQGERSLAAFKQRYPFAINNVLWLTALRLAQDQGVTHMLFLETDCRVGVDYWDGVMFDEYFALGKPLVCGGSLGVFNPCNAGQVAAQRWAELVRSNTRRNVPIPTYGWLGAAQKAESCVFPNGALAIYDVAWMAKLFDLSKTTQLAMCTTAFDMELGKRLWSMFGADAYTVVGHMNSAFSSYGDVMTTEDERLKWLYEGRYVAVHQVKSDRTA